MLRIRELFAAAVIVAAFAIMIARAPKGDQRGGAVAFTLAFGPLTLALAVCALRAREERSWRPIQQLGFSVLGGLTAGLTLGPGARIGMRLVAVASGQTPKFTIGGTAAVVAVFALFGLSLALVYRAFLWRRLPGKGTTFGLLLGALTWYPFARIAAHDLHRTLHHPTVLAGATLFALGLWVPYALALEAILARLSRRWVKAG